ncbi:hypothetical protein H072_7682 [Dactylellina haptotyla CBS 200.50]|uniref:Uncharacterized protein n=1 Tax=Dactylellina haptotyla (strain CBS 200.50) TaxID=1284197 RepID=S8ABR8_DACHA|nr:hypothetical protein H072_7682 [Dactylellina haptotyla CBS 200.50]
MSRHLLRASGVKSTAIICPPVELLHQLRTAPTIRTLVSACAIKGRTSILFLASQRQQQQQVHRASIAGARPTHKPAPVLTSPRIRIHATAPPCPPPPPPSRPEKSATVLLTSLRKAGIDITPKGYKILCDTLEGLPFHGIDIIWIKRVEAAILAFERTSGDVVNKSDIQPAGSKKSWEEWVQYQVDRLSERLIACVDWAGVYDLDMFLMDEGLRIGGDGEVRDMLGALVRNGWVVAVEEEESLYELMVRESWSF